MQITNEEIEILNRAIEILSKFCNHGAISRDTLVLFENLVVSAIDSSGDFIEQGSKHNPQFAYEIKNKGIEIKSYIGNKSSLELAIPDSINGLPVTSIGYSAFEGMYIESVNLPDTLREIQARAFARCFNLKDIRFPSALSSIGGSAFSECRSLKRICLPNGLERIDWCAFEDCINLENVVLPTSLKRLGNRSFSNTKISHIEVPGSVSTIPTKCFANNIFLKSVSIGHGVKVIEERAFCDTQISKLTIPQSVHHLQASVIQSCIDNHLIQIAILGMNTRINVSKDSRTFPDGITIFCHPESVTAQKGAIAGYRMRPLEEFLS